MLEISGLSGLFDRWRCVLGATRHFSKDGIHLCEIPVLKCPGGSIFKA